MATTRNIVWRRGQDLVGEWGSGLVEPATRVAGLAKKGRAQPIAAGRLWQRRKSGPPGMHLMTAHGTTRALRRSTSVSAKGRHDRSARVSPGQSPFVNCSQLNTLGLYHV